MSIPSIPKQGKRSRSAYKWGSTVMSLPFPWFPSIMEMNILKGAVPGSKGKD